MNFYFFSIQYTYILILILIIIVNGVWAWIKLDHHACVFEHHTSNIFFNISILLITLVGFICIETNIPFFLNKVRNLLLDPLYYIFFVDMNTFGLTENS